MPFLDRFEAAAKAGFKAVEFLFPYAYPVAELQTRLKGHDLKLVLHNLPAGDWDAGERGIACHPDRVDEFRAGVARGIEYGTALGVPQLNCLAGKAPAGVDEVTLRRTFVANLRFAAAELKKAKLNLLIEPINTLRHPRLLPQPHRAGAVDPGRGRRGQRLRAVRHLPRAAHGRRARRHAQQAPGAHRPHPAGRQPGAQRAGHRRDQLRLPVRAPRPHRLQGLDRLRVQAGRAHRSRPGLDRRAAARAEPTEAENNNDHTPLKLGFIGLGIMGAPMARPPDQGRPPAVRAHARQAARRDRRRARATQCTSAKGVAERADIVFTMVPDTPDVEAVLFGDERRGRGSVARARPWST